MGPATGVVTVAPVPAPGGPSGAVATGGAPVSGIVVLPLSPYPGLGISRQRVVHATSANVIGRAARRARRTRSTAAPVDCSVISPSPPAPQRPDRARPRARRRTYASV